MVEKIIADADKAILKLEFVKAHKDGGNHSSYHSGAQMEEVIDLIHDKENGYIIGGFVYFGMSKKGIQIGRSIPLMKFIDLKGPRELAWDYTEALNLPSK